MSSDILYQQQQQRRRPLSRGTTLTLLLLSVWASAALTWTMAEAAAADGLPAPNNILFLGRGYNIFKGDPHAKTVDPGFEAQVFDLGVYTEGRTTSDRRLRVPNGADVLKSEFCRKSFSATTVSESFSYDAALMSEVTVGGGLDEIGVAFSASPGFRKVHEGVTNTGLLVVDTTSRCEIYTATMLRNDLPPLTQNFVTAMESLPDRFQMDGDDVDLFWRFFRTFGTHVATRISFGSRLSIRHEVLSQALDTFAERGSSLELIAEASAEAVYLRAGAKLDRLKADTDAFSRLIVSTEILAVGGLNHLNRLNEDWRHLTLANDLVPIRYVLDPIVNHVAPWRRAAVGAALSQFCDSYPGARCHLAPARHERVCNGPVFPDPWAYSACSVREPERWVALGCGPDHGLGALRLARSGRYRHRYLMTPGCMALREADDVADDDHGQYGAPVARRTSRDQAYGCPDGEFITGLRLNRACFGAENVAVRCKRSRRPFRQCRWLDAIRDGIDAIPAYSTATCADGEVVNTIVFLSNPEANVARQRLRLRCCKFDDDCRQHDGGPFQDDPIPVEPPADD